MSAASDKSTAKSLEKRKVEALETIAAELVKANTPLKMVRKGGENRPGRVGPNPNLREPSRPFPSAPRIPGAPVIYSPLNGVEPMGPNDS